MVKRTRPTVEGAGGVIVRDSIGGEALQFVSNEAIPKMTRVVLYRRAPADVDLTVTLGLAGYDTVFFDDLRVERVEAAPAFEPPGVAASPAPEAVDPPPLRLEAGDREQADPVVRTCIRRTVAPCLAGEGR